MKVLVLGAAVSGLAAARLARSLGHDAVVYDAAPGGVAALTGAWTPRFLAGIDLVVTSPGFPETSAPIEDTLSAGVPLWSEVELAFRHLDAPLVGVTGTNGKTTVTTLVSGMLTASGLRAPAAGNIGRPLSDLVGQKVDAVVAELSSFQLRFIDSLRAPVAVVTNFAPDHLDWHRDLSSYEAAKRRIVDNQAPGDLLVIDDSDPGVRRLAAAAPGHVHAVRLPAGLAEWGLGVDDLPVPDEIFSLDTALAAAAAAAAGATTEGIVTAARAFVPPPHRRRLVAERDGVRFVDDSKATNPHAALAALDAYPSVVLIAGGLAKGLDVAPLARHPHLRRLVAIGEAAPVLLAAGGERAVAAGSMDEAVAAAVDAARPGDVVLLAPGCASFDQFPDYGARGDAFARAVGSLERRGT